MSSGSVNPDFKPLHNICEFLNAVHIYADEARRGETRYVQAHHFCSHVRKGKPANQPSQIPSTTPLQHPSHPTKNTANPTPDLRQCLIYDSGRADARLIGIEYMIPKHVYLTLDPAEQNLWHSHEYEVTSGMLCVIKPSSEPSESEWEKKEIEAMREVVGLYGKTWHTWQVDRGDELPLGKPVLMGSVTSGKQIDLERALAGRNEEYGVDHGVKAENRAKAGVKGPGTHENADFWWREAGMH
ncbi:hypothetical protein PMZ80_010214 [Knufia obscura]|uniref:DUF1264-domain-containing protein n=1 Tax=Knufia obscura TaxID=1635080 RepID=A0ABR0RBJ6_9EURO|nr:hypothetical protein PMZ80_010214 [Knufia obscura]